MSVFFRLLSLILIVAALMLLGADMVTSLEKGSGITVRSLGQVWMLIGKASAMGFDAWLAHSAPAMVGRSVQAVLALPGWAATGVPGIILAFVFGRRSEH